MVIKRFRRDSKMLNLMHKTQKKSNFLSFFSQKKMKILILVGEKSNTDPDTLVRLCHDLPAKMNEIYRLKGKKIPSNFDPRKSPFACHCDICSS